MKKARGFVFFLFVFTQAVAQQDQFSTWQVSLGGGLALPVLGFKKVDIENSISVRDGNILVFEFFDKEHNGNAKPGYFISASVSKILFRRFPLSFNIDFTENRVGIAAINNFYDETMNSSYYHSFTQDNYIVHTEYLGFGYQIRDNKWSFAFQPLIGIGNMAFPEYELKVIRDTSWGDLANTVSQHYQHEGETAAIHSLAYGFQFQIGLLMKKGFIIELHSKYMSADFEYTIVPKTVGIDPRVRNDIVNYRIIDLGLKAGLLL